MANVTECSLHLLDDERAAIIKTVALIVLCLLLVVGNILVLAILANNREMRTTTNIFIANMAVSDLMFGLMCVPKEIVLQLSNHAWLVGGDFGSFSCKFVNFVQDTSTAVSIYSHIAIAIERFYAVVFPLRARRSSTYLHIIVVATTWVVSIGYQSIYFYFLRLESTEEGHKCVKNWGDLFGDNHLEIDKNYYLVSFASLYAIPVFIIATLYSIILYKLNCRQIVGNDFTMRSVREITQNRRVVRLAICIVFTFILLWAPIHVIILLSFFTKLNPCGFENLIFATFFLAWSSGFSNTLIYFIFSENYRNGLKNLLASCLVIHPRIHPRPQAPETTEGALTESRARSGQVQRAERTTDETVT